MRVSSCRVRRSKPPLPPIASDSDGLPRGPGQTLADARFRPPAGVHATEARQRLGDASELNRMVVEGHATARTQLAHRPRRYLGELTLICATSPYSGNELDSALGWNAWAADIRVMTGPGEYLTLSGEPHVGAVAAARTR